MSIGAPEFEILSQIALIKGGSIRYLSFLLRAFQEIFVGNTKLRLVANKKALLTPSLQIDVSTQSSPFRLNDVTSIRDLAISFSSDANICSLALGIRRVVWGIACDLLFG